MTDTPKIPIRYVGKKPEETDHTYGTGITWHTDEIHDVPVDKACFLLNHPDVWEDARPKGAIKKAPVQPAEPVRQYAKDEDIVIPSNLPSMDADALRTYVLQNWGEQFPEGATEQDIRSRAILLLHIKPEGR